MGRWWIQKPAARIVVVFLLLVAACTVPRLVATHGVSMTSHLKFMDAFYHLSKLDIIHKKKVLGAEQLADPYFKRNPGLLRPYETIRWPAGVYRIGLLWVGAFGPQSIWTVQLTNLFFSLLLALGVVLLGRAMGEIRIGLWGAALTLLCPALVAHSWYFSLDYPLAAMIVIGLYLLWETQGFSRLRHSLAFAVWSSLAMLIKVTYPLYLAGPAVAALVVGLRNTTPRWRPVLHLGVATGVTLVGSFLLNGWSLGMVWNEFWVHFAGVVDETHFPYTLVKPWTVRWGLAMVIFAVANFPWPLLLVALPGLVLAHTRQALPARWLLLSFFWTTCLLLTLFANKMERYLQPIYPVICLLTVWAVFARVPRRWRTMTLAWVVTLYGAVLWLVHEHPTPWFPDRESATTERYMHELGMPGREVLDGLRRNTHHPSCEMKPLLDQVVALARRTGHRRPLAVAVQWQQEPPGLPNLTSFGFHLGTIQRLRRRFVFHHDGPNDEPLTAHLLEAPALIVLHPPGLDLTRRHAGIEVVESRPVEARCGTGPVAARLTLFKPRRGHGEEGE